ncbi:hypothetical protein JZ751_004208, partial [Albula glossodonta]
MPKNRRTSVRGQAPYARPIKNDREKDDTLRNGVPEPTIRLNYGDNVGVANKPDAHPRK